MSWVASLRSRTATDDPSAMIAIGLGVVIFETHLAGLLDVEIALGLAAVGPDLDEISDQRLQRRQIGADLGGLRLLIGVEGRENIGGDIAARIGNHRIRRLRRVAPVVAGPRCGSDALICVPSRAFRRGLRNRNALRGSRRRAVSMAVAISAASQPSRCACRESRIAAVIRDFGFLFNASSCWLRPFYRAFGQSEISFFRENMTSTPAIRWPDDAVQKPLSSSSTRISRLPA